MEKKKLELSPTYQVYVWLLMKIHNYFLFLYINALNKLSLILNLQMASNTTLQMKCSYKDCGEAIEPESNRADVRGFNVPKSDRKGIILYHIHVHRILFLSQIVDFCLLQRKFELLVWEIFCDCIEITFIWTL